MVPDVVDDRRRAAIDARGAVVQIGCQHIRRAVHAKMHAANGETCGTVLINRVIVVTDRSPDEVVAAAHAGNPGRAPDRVVAPYPAVRHMIPPAPIVAGHIAEGVAADPGMPHGRHIAPASVAVGHIFGDHGGPPVVGTIHMHPLAVAVQCVHADGLGGDGNRLGHGDAAGRQQGRPLAVPFVKRVGLRLVERGCLRRQKAHVDPAPLALGKQHIAPFGGAHIRLAPVHADGGVPILQHIDARCGIGLHGDDRGRAVKHEFARGTPQPLHVERALPAAHRRARRHALNLALASVGHP